MPAKRLAKTIAVLFGAELRRARKHAGLTQQALAEQADVDPVFISFLENGHRQPSLTVLFSLEHVLGLEPGESMRRVSAKLPRSELPKVPRRAARRGK